MLGISAIWTGAIEVALTDGAIEVLDIEKENVLENCPATPKSDEKDFGYFAEQSSLQENTVYCTTGKRVRVSVSTTSSGFGLSIYSSSSTGKNSAFNSIRSGAVAMG